jgi:hypothetical protein
LRIFQLFCRKGAQAGAGRAEIELHDPSLPLQRALLTRLNKANRFLGAHSQIFLFFDFLDGSCAMLLHE